MRGVFWFRLPKMTQMSLDFARDREPVERQGGLPEAGVPSPLGPDVLEVRRSENRGKPTQQMGLFQRP